jgi:hypothetical protein
MILDAYQMRTLWLRNGGDPNRTLVMLSIARAESGWQSDAVSPSDDHGLWQINRVHFGEFGVNDQSVLAIDTNCRIAIALSGNGFNVAPWCTCWLDPGSNCGNGLLRDPQANSPAYNEESLVAGALRVTSPSDAPPVQTTQVSDVHAAWNLLNYGLGNWSDSVLAQVSAIDQGMRGLIR